MFLSGLVLLIQSCKDDVKPEEALEENQPYNLVIPKFFPPMPIPADNPMTVKGVELGRMLFYDPILSSDGSISCASCHNPEFSFTDDKKFSVGVGGQQGTINSMSLVNLGWQTRFFWNGRATSLEEQAKEPITNPIEMHETLPGIVNKLRAHESYPKRFQVAFGTKEITADLVAKALAQFERTLISGDTPFDRYFDIAQAAFTPLQFRGYKIFSTEEGDCFHCHGIPVLQDLDSLYRNNGLFMNVNLPQTRGYGAVTGDPKDNGKFKVPSLRNVSLTAPYMHDGRFQTLEEVVNFYSSGIQFNDNIDVNLLKNNRDIKGGLGLTNADKEALVAFLKCLVDTAYLNNPAHQNPFK